MEKIDIKRHKKIEQFRIISEIYNIFANVDKHESLEQFKEYYKKNSSDFKGEAKSRIIDLLNSLNQFDVITRASDFFDCNDSMTCASIMAHWNGIIYKNKFYEFDEFINNIVMKGEK